MKKIGVCLAGCGFRDGAEIHEAVLTLLALDRAGVEIFCIAPDMEHRQIVNHLNNQKQQETRSVLVESARIARGNIRALKNVTARDMDALIFPGGFGAALNLCDFGLNGDKCTVYPDVNRIICDMYQAKKPIGAICIAPVILAKVLGDKKITVTIGNDSSTAKKIEAMGAKHQNCAVQDIVVDTANKIVTTPAYMMATRISEAAAGIEKLVKKIVEMLG